MLEYTQLFPHSYIFIYNTYIYAKQVQNPTNKVGEKIQQKAKN